MTCWSTTEASSGLFEEIERQERQEIIVSCRKGAKRLMKRIRFILCQPEFSLLLFFFSLFLFVAPFQRNADKTGLEAIFFYLFLAWGFICLLLFLMSRELTATPDNNEDET